MKDFNIHTLIFTEIILCIFIYAIYRIRICLLQKCKIAAQKSLLPFKNKDIPFYYSSYAVKQECICDFFHLPVSQTKQFIFYASWGNYQSHRLQRILKDLHKHQKNFSLQLLKAQILLNTDQHIPFRHTIQKVHPPLFISNHERAEYYYLKAQNELYETDMQTASAHCSNALKLYQKLGFVYEEAECYLLLSQIYRITGLFDVAETMLKEANKRFRKLKMNAKKTECMAYLGLIAFGREQYDTAIQYLSGAVAKAKHHKLHRTYADINNWLGLAFYMNRKLGKAERSFLIALKNCETKNCKAYAAEMLARIRFRNKNYKTAVNYINTALDVSNFQIDPAGWLEKLYLKAEILFAQQQYPHAKKILTKIIRKKLSPTIPFYPANAYTLLGLIYLKENQLQQAKNLFKQAVDLEHGKNRLKGAAIDYNNLAEIAKKQGYRDEAEIYLLQAVKYAEETDDNKLKTYLKNKLN